jgi:hypothetical protein
MFVPIRGRFRVCELGYEWTDSRSGQARITERAIPKWKIAPETTNMAVEIANVDLDDSAGMHAFLERWGLPIIKYETKPATMTVADFDDLVRNVRDVVGHASRRDAESFKAQFDKHAIFAARPRSDPEAAPGEPAVFVECRDPAAMAWFQLAQRERIGAEYRRCGACETYFVVSGADGHRRSRQYCSDRCRVAANRARKSADQ